MVSDNILLITTYFVFRIKHTAKNSSRDFESSVLSHNSVKTLIYMIICFDPVMS